jgi:predicted O-methyltransferase YrrM
VPGDEEPAAAPNPVLERLYRENEVVHRNGKRKPLCPPGLTRERGEYLFRLVRERRPTLTLEVGFAYGVSTLFIAEGLRRNGRGHHLVIDPNQRTRFDGLGLRHLEEARLSPWVTFYEEPAELCLPRLVQEGVRLDLAFDDSDHLFDHVITEFLFLTLLLRNGGVLVFDDVRLPGVGRACDFIAANRPDFAELTEKNSGRGGWRGLLEWHPLPLPPPQMRVFRKIADDDPRDWKDFVAF